MKALGATALYVFGSTARDEATARNDLDLFIDYDRDRRFSLVGTGQHQTAFGRPSRRSGPRNYPGQFGSAAAGSDRGFGPTRFLIERLVRPAPPRLDPGVAILEATEGIETAMQGKTLDDFGSDWLLRHGVERGIEIVSEAARHNPPELQA